MRSRRGHGRGHNKDNSQNQGQDQQGSNGGLVPSIPLLSSVLPSLPPPLGPSDSSQQSSSSNSNPPAAAPAAAPAPAAPPAAASPASSPASASNDSPSSGGSSSNTGGSSGNSGSSTPPEQLSSNSNASPQNAGSNQSPSSPSVPAAAAQVSGPVSVIGSSTFVVTPTGLVPQADANTASNPSGGSSNPGDPGSPSNNPSASQGFPGTPAGSQPPPGSSDAFVSGNNGSGGNDGSNSASGGSAAHKGLSGGAIGGIVFVVILACTVIAFFIIRNRYKRRREERRVEWVNGYVSDLSKADISKPGPEMLQRGRSMRSMRSSWGTPFEYRISNPFRRSVASSPSDDQEHNYIIPDPLPNEYEQYMYNVPAVPMPVHSSPQLRAHSPEDPFGDAGGQPVRRMSSLPLRISVLSSASGHMDPFDDEHAPRAVTTDDTAVPFSAKSAATFGHVQFPLPPPSAGGAGGSPQPLTPGFLIDLPESPVATKAGGRVTSLRSATVKEEYVPSSSRADEVRVERGESVRIVSVYEDGWAFVERDRDNARGLVPLSFLEM